MTIYTCDICNISTHLVGNYKRHLNTFKHKRNIENKQKNMVLLNKTCKMNQKEPQMNQNEPKNNKTDKLFFCEYCDQKFKSIPSKRRHELHRCIENNNEVSLFKKLYKDSQKEKSEYKKQIKMLLNKVGNVTNTTITNNSNIQLNSYGNEDLSHITDTMKSDMLKIPYGMIPKFIEAVHFNDEKPENKNILLTNKRDNKIKIFSGNKWIYKTKDDTINDLVDGKYFILDSHYDNIIDNLCKMNIDPKKYEEFRSKYDENNKELIEKIKAESELVLLNNR